MVVINCIPLLNSRPVNINHMQYTLDDNLVSSPGETLPPRSMFPVSALPQSFLTQVGSMLYVHVTHVCMLKHVGMTVEK